MDAFHSIIQQRVPHAKQKLFTLPSALDFASSFHSDSSCPVICVSLYYVGFFIFFYFEF